MKTDMQKSKFLPRRLHALTLISSLILVGCGGGSSDSILDSGSGTPENPIEPDPTVEVADLSLIASSNQLPSNGSGTSTIFAIARDENNAVVGGATVVFSADSGALKIVSAVTNSDGVAEAELTTAGDPTNRNITVNASTADQAATIQVDVVGSNLILTGLVNVVFGDIVQYTARLQDSGGSGIAGETVDFTSVAGNTLSATSLVTDSEGEATAQLTATQSGDDTVSAMALGLTATQDLTVSNDSFSFLAPAAATEILLGDLETVTVEWLIGGQPQSGTVNFFTTRGTLSSGTASLDASGRASVDISSTNAGPAVVTASVTGGPVIQLGLEFVATTAAKISVQASRFTVGIGEQSTISATVRDPNDNPVKGKVVIFELTDVTGGSISVGGQTTDSAGKAETVYTAGQTVSASGGVQIRAFVQDNPAVEGTVALTVAQQEVDISIGTGNQIAEPNSADYLKQFSVRVTDSQGVGVAGVNVQMSVFSKRYFKGLYQADAVASLWVATIAATCDDEDVNRNGQLDPGEDFNNSGSIEAGNVATVAPGSIVTDANGFGLVDLTYAQEFGNWVEVTIQAKAAVTGTEFLETQDYVLEVSAADVALSQSPPGGLVSRWGQTATCATLD
jgi:hypothetical protein